MRRSVSLYIAGMQVDLDEQSFILMNYTMEDLSNPTIVKNSFSKQVTLKGTPNNNRIFGRVYRLDRVTRGRDSYIGADFDATRKTPFVVYNEMNEILEEGYAKLDKITRNGAEVSYSVTLYGGLGSFLYNLIYNEDGSKKTLADLAFRNGETEQWSDDYSCADGFSPYEVYQGWEYLEYAESWDRWQSTQFKFWNALNFAPVYNGLPDNFSADKAVEMDTFKNVPDSASIDGTRYALKTGTSSRLLTFTNTHDMWEMRDLRWYLLRPIVRVKELLLAISHPDNNGGYQVDFTDKVSSELIEKGWMTLPAIPYEMRQRADLFQYLLSSTMSPGEFLISLAKVFGLHILVDMQTKRVRVMTRSEFFADTALIDMTDRVDISSIQISPVVATSRYYQFGNNVIGEFAKDYKNTYGIDYGIQKVDTGYEFNNEVSVLTKDIGFKEAVDVQERSLLFSSIDYGVENGFFKEWLTLPKYESVNVQLWGTPSGETEQSMEEVAVKVSNRYRTFSIIPNPEYPTSDWLPKVQLHDAGGKQTESTGVLLLFNGIKDCPVGDNDEMLYRISDDTKDMMLLNDNTPTWNFTDTNVIKIAKIPSFRRSCTSKNAGVEYPSSTWEWGIPRERGLHDYGEGTEPTIYNEYWKRYMSDRYDNDTICMTCKADLRGLLVGQSLLGRFFFYQGAVFVLNKITNHSLTTWNDTECEFIKVQDINNYIG